MQGFSYSMTLCEAIQGYSPFVLSQFLLLFFFYVTFCPIAIVSKRINGLLLKHVWTWATVDGRRCRRWLHGLYNVRSSPQKQWLIRLSSICSPSEFRFAHVLWTLRCVLSMHACTSFIFRINNCKQRICSLFKHRKPWCETYGTSKALHVFDKLLLKFIWFNS